MTTPKQRENEEKFLKPALGQLKPYYADLFDKIMRGKRRGDGLMIDPETKDKLEKKISKLYDTRKMEKRKVKEEERKQLYEEVGIPESRYRDRNGDVKWLYKLKNDNIISQDRKEELDDELSKRVSNRSDEFTQVTDDDRFKSEAVYVINTIQSDDRGTMNMKAQFMATYLHSPDMMDRRSKELKAVAEVFEKYRSSTESVDVTVDEQVERLAGRLYGESMADAMKERGRKKQEFVDRCVLA